MSPHLLLPALVGVVAGLIVALAAIAVSVNRQRSSAARHPRRCARGGGAAARARRCGMGRRPSPKCCVAAKIEALKQREELDREGLRRREEWERLERRADERTRAHERKLEELEVRERALRKREETLAQGEQGLRAREGEADRLAQEQRVKLERIAGPERRGRAARDPAAGRGRGPRPGAGAGARHQGAGQARRRPRRAADHLDGHPAHRRRAHGGEHGRRRGAAQRGDEGPHHRPRGPQHPRVRDRHRRGRHHRRHARYRERELLRPDPARGGPALARGAGRRTDGSIRAGSRRSSLKAQKELEAQLVELGEQAAYDTGIHGLHPELIRLIGRMRYRTSYGQNIYDHSKEVAWLAGMMAAELHLDVALAKRGGLLHDVGKVLTHDNEGTHVELGVEVARRYGESGPVINCIQAHHDDVPHESAESVLVQAADAISGSRPGARREAFETYVKRLTRLEEIANGFPGVEKSNVIQAGREVRVVVTPERIDDGAAALLSENIARKIEHELQYPGQIKVVVIRETRSVDYAR